MTDYRALCARMADELDHYHQLLMDDRRETHALAAEARAALAQPEPQGPTDEEIDDWHGRCADLTRLGEADHYWAFDLAHDEVAGVVRAALARWGRPAIEPVPVAERLPGPEDCDEEGRCWLCGKVEGDWRLLNPANSGVPQLKYCFSHWLPHHALPVPQWGGQPWLS
jgi:hypothetical protein